MEINKPWVVTETLKSEIHKKYVLYEAAKEKKTDSDWQAYKEQRILVGKMITAAKLEYIGLHPEAVSIFLNAKVFIFLPLKATYVLELYLRSFLMNSGIKERSWSMKQKCFTFTVE